MAEKQRVDYGKRKRKWKEIEQFRESNAKYGSKSVSTQVDMDVKRNKRQIKSLLEAKDVKTTKTGVTTAMLAAGSIQMCSNPLQGDGEDQRIANKIKSLSLNIAGSLTLVGSKEKGLARIAVVIDHDQQGIIPTFEMLWTNSQSFSSGHPRNLTVGSTTSFKRFTILYDEFFVMNATGVGVTQADVNVLTSTFTKVHKWYRKIFHIINFSDNLQVIASMRQGNLFVLSAADSDSTVTCDVEIIYKFTG